MWTPHTDENPCYLHITEKLTMVNERLYTSRWNYLNDLVESEPIILSPPSSPIASSKPDVMAMPMEETLKNRFYAAGTALDPVESTAPPKEIPNLSQTLYPSNSDHETLMVSNSEYLKRQISLELSTSTKTLESQLSSTKKSSLDDNNTISNQTE